MDDKIRLDNLEWLISFLNEEYEKGNWKNIFLKKQFDDNFLDGFLNKLLVEGIFIGERKNEILFTLIKNQKLSKKLMIKYKDYLPVDWLIEYQEIPERLLEEKFNLFKDNMEEIIEKKYLDKNFLIFFAKDKSEKYQREIIYNLLSFYGKELSENDIRTIINNYSFMSEEVFSYLLFQNTNNLTLSFIKKNYEKLDPKAVTVYFFDQIEYDKTKDYPFLKNFFKRIPDIDNEEKASIVVEILEIFYYKKEGGYMNRKIFELISDNFLKEIELKRGSGELKKLLDFFLLENINNVNDIYIFFKKDKSFLNPYLKTKSINRITKLLNDKTRLKTFFSEEMLKNINKKYDEKTAKNIALNKLVTMLNNVKKIKRISKKLELSDLFLEKGR